MNDKPVPDCTIFFLAKAYQKAHSMFKQRLKPYHLTNLQHLVLEGLWYQEGQTAAELGKLLVLDKATLSGVLERMEESGWIIRRQDPEDRRLVRLYTSPRTESMKEELLRIRIEANDELLAGFSLEEKFLFKRMLRDLM